MASAEPKRNFRKVQNFSTDWSTEVVTQYESQRSGMQVVVVDHNGPKVNGYFALATEIHDDSGAPHTLEHLIFMGSKNYPYKGVLDKLASRAYADTNAWTAVDHTAYILETAGWEGFAQILPVYLEHILLPTLTDEGCYTEVHHVDGTGHDAGVVYSEMQGVQNTASELMDLKTRRLVYPESVGFRYETGGMMEPLRKLSADRIRDFHREMYRPNNLCLVIAGVVDHKNLLDVLNKFEDSVIDALPSLRKEWKRPWVDSPPTPPLRESRLETIEFPEEDESAGEVEIAYLGPDTNDKLQSTALDIMLVYLAGSSVSVLENTLVEKEQLASEVINSVDPRPDNFIQFTLSSVATGKLALVEKRVLEVLRETASKPLNMDYLMECIHREKRQKKYDAEESPFMMQSEAIIDYLFGRRDGSTLRALETLKKYDEVAQWSDAQWRQFLRRWISDAAHVSVLGVPSAKLSEKMKSDELARVEKRKAALGEEGLKKLEEKLARAKAANEVEIPPSLIEKFDIPDPNKISFIHTITARSGLAREMGSLNNSIQDIVNHDTPESPLFLHFEHVQSNFVQISLVVSTESVPVEKRPLLSLYLQNFFNTPIMRDGQKVEFEKVVTSLEKDTIDYTIGSGKRFGNWEVVQITFRVEPEKYEVAIQWLKEMLWTSVFDETRLRATTTKILASIPEEKRNGGQMVNAVAQMVNQAPESNRRATDTLVRALYFKRVSQLLKSDPKQVISDLEEVRKKLCRFENFRVLVVADLKKLKKPVTSWSTFTDGLDVHSPLQRLDSPAERLSKVGRKPGGVAYVVPMATIDSTYSSQFGRGLDSYDHPQYPALLIAQYYLNEVEGPFWRAIRGTGLAYGSTLGFAIESGMADFTIYRSPDAYKAFVAGRKVVEDFISGETQFEKPAMEGAISQIVLNFADEQPSMISAGQASFVNQVMRGLPKDYSAQILEKVRKTSVEEIKAVLKQVVLPVFQPDKSNLIVACATVETDRIKQGFESEGFKVEVRSLTSFQDDYGLKPIGDEPEDDDDEEDEEGDDGDDEQDE